MVSQAQSLRHDEARERARLLRVTGYDVELDLTGEETFASHTTISFESEGGETFLDLKPASVSTITLDGQPLEVDLLHEGRLPLTTSSGTHRLAVDAVMAFRNDGEGLHRSVDPADGRHYVYGMNFMDAAPTVYACFDQPDLKAPYTFTVRAPEDWLVVGNAPAEQVEPGRWRIGPTPPLSTYFVTVVAGPYHLLRAEHDGIPLSLSVRRSLAADLDRDAEELFTLTGQCFDEFHRLFGIRYPFGDYHQAFVPEFNAGAMENPGCITLRDAMVFDTRVTRGARVKRASTIAHEMAHQWFGDITTPRWWDDLWLNESFAEYMGYRVVAEATAYDDAWAYNAWARRQWGLLADARPSTHPVAGNGAADAVSALQDFDGISYSKGSTLLRQLAASFGDQVFFDGVVDHLQTHRFGNATMHDLLGSWERAGAGDLSDVVGQWLRTAGPDIFTLSRASSPGVESTLRRTPPSDHPAERSHTFDVARCREGEWTSEPVRVTGTETPVETGQDPIVIDPGHVSWGVYVPDETTLAGLVTELPRIADPDLVAAVWNNVKSGFNVGRVAPDRVIDLVAAAYPVLDSEDETRHTLPWLLADVVPAAGHDAPARLHRSARAAFETADPGSEAQLTAFRAVVRTALDADELRGWLGGVPSGVEADSDLRWRLLKRLAVLGAVDADELDAELAAQPTASAREAHARARASLPDPEAKAWAWARFIGAVDVSNYELSATGAGMWSGPEEHTAPYVERYVAELPGTARVRSGWNLAKSAEDFFPTLVSTAVRDAVGTLLEPGVLETGMRRKVVDCVSDLDRALVVRTRYPQ